MGPKQCVPHKTVSAVAIVSIIAVLMAMIPGSVAGINDEDYPIEAYANPVNPYGWGNSSPYLVHDFPTLTIEPLSTPSPSVVKNANPVETFDITISPFSAISTGQKTNQIVGYISTMQTGITLNIEGKEPADVDFSDIGEITPDENGLFLWSVPSSLENTAIFRVAARHNGGEVLSNVVRFADEENSDEEKDPVAVPVIAPVTSPVPIIKPVVSPVPVLTTVPTTSRSSYSLSLLTISASTTTPAVGEEVTITGRLTDQDGNGISGATVTMDESGYTGGDPLTTTQTGSDGSFEFTVGVSYAYTVGMLAHYAGDSAHSAADSNTIMFTAH